jgi:hypothetical protein
MSELCGRARSRHLRLWAFVPRVQPRDRRGVCTRTSDAPAFRTLVAVQSSHSSSCEDWSSLRAALMSRRNLSASLRGETGSTCIQVVDFCTSCSASDKIPSAARSCDTITDRRQQWQQQHHSPLLLDDPPRCCLVPRGAISYVTGRHARLHCIRRQPQSGCAGALVVAAGKHLVGTFCSGAHRANNGPDQTIHWLRTHTPVNG